MDFGRNLPGANPTLTTMAEPRAVMAPTAGMTPMAASAMGMQIPSMVGSAELVARELVTPAAPLRPLKFVGLSGDGQPVPTRTQTQPYARHKSHSNLNQVSQHLCLALSSQARAQP